MRATGLLHAAGATASLSASAAAPCRAATKVVGRGPRAADATLGRPNIRPCIAVFRSESAQRPDGFCFSYQNNGNVVSTILCTSTVVKRSTVAAVWEGCRVPTSLPLPFPRHH